VTAVPVGFGLVADPSLRRYADGHVLVGGTPLRVLRLSQTGRDQCEGLLRGELVNGTTGVLARRLLDAGLAHPRPPAHTPAISATVVIPVRDRPRQLDRCLRAIRRIAPVVVVDDGSKQPDAIAAVCASHGARLVRLAHSRGPSAARNAPLPDIHTDLVAFVDSDTAPEQGWLEALSSHFTDPTVGAAAPRIRPIASGTSLLERYALVRSPLDMGAQGGSVIPYGRVPYVPTATIVVRRDALHDGGFDEGFRCAEDVDLVWRLHDAGWQVRYDPRVIVRHDEPRTWREFLGRHRYYGEWSAPLSRRHPGRLAHLVLAPVPAAAAVLLLLRRPRASLAVAVLQALMLTARLRRSGVPARQSWPWTVKAIALTIVGLGRAATLFGAPILVVFLGVQRTRRVAATLLLAFPVNEFIAKRPLVGPISWLLAVTSDEFAYGLGVWKGCVRTRTTRPLRPLWITRKHPGGPPRHHPGLSSGPAS
jgi:mycofactocin system glycosyltransferase